MMHSSILRVLFERSHSIKTLGVLFILGLGNCSLHAQTWTASSSSNWSVTTNWAGGVAPVSSTTTSLTFELLSVSSSTGYTATNDIANPFSLNALTFSNSSGTITIAGGELNFTGTNPGITLAGIGHSVISAPVNLSAVTTIGGTANGTLTISGAITTPSGSSTPGALVINTPGTVILSGGGTFNDGTTAGTGGYIWVELGTLKLTSGAYTMGFASAANNLAGLQVSSASLSTTATLAMSAGATLTSPYVYIARLASSNGVATVDGFGTTLTGSTQLTVGSRAGAVGTLTITNGGLVTSINISNSLSIGSVSTVNVVGTDASGDPSTFSSPGGHIQLAPLGSATLTISAGGVSTCAILNMGAGLSGSVGTGAVGTLNVMGTSSAATPVASSFTATTEIVVGGGSGAGSPGVGNITASAGGQVTSGGPTYMNFETGGVTSEVSTITVTGAGSTYTGSGQLYMLYGNSNFNVQAGGAATFSSAASVAIEPGSIATITVTGSGSTFTSAGIQVGGNGATAGGAGTLNITSGGTATITEALFIYTGSSVTVNSGTLNVGYLSDITGVSSGNISLTSSTMTVGSANVSSTYSGVISGNGNLVVTGTGTLTLNGLNTYTGTTTINSGTLQVGGSTGTGAISVMGTGTLRGTGTAAGAVTVASGGTLAAGTATTAGTFTLANGLTTQSGSTITINLNANTNTVGGTSTDLFTVSAGTINLNTGSILTINALSGVTYTNSFWLSSETFHSIMTSPSAATVGTITPYTVTSVGTFTLVADGHNVDLIFNPTPTPEPSSVLAMMGLFGVSYAALRRKNLNF